MLAMIFPQRIRCVHDEKEENADKKEEKWRDNDVEQGIQRLDRIDICVESKETFRNTSNVGTEYCSKISKTKRCDGFFRTRRCLLASLIVFLGGVSCAAFLALGINDEIQSSQLYFEQSAANMALAIQDAWHDYELFAHWAHESCSKLPSSRPPSEQTLQEKLKICSHQEFRNLYEQIISFGVHIYSLQYVSKVEHEHRAAVEKDLADFLAENAPSTNFTGFSVYPDLKIQKENLFYFPILHAEPLDRNAAVIGLDTYEGTRGKTMIDTVLSTWKPLLSPAMKLVQDTDPNAYSVYLVHPGVNSSVLQDPPQAVTSTVIRIPDLLKHASKEALHSIAVHLYDSTESRNEPQMLGAMEIYTAKCAACSPEETHVRLVSRSYPEVINKYSYFEKEIQIVGRRWLVVVVPLDNSQEPTLKFIILGGILLFFASILLAWLFRNYMQRIVTINQIKTEAEMEKTNMAIEQVKRERHLNTYLAHEIRNPLASAMAALSFISANTRELDCDNTTRQTLLDDEHVVDSSLNYINDLLRSMLDMSKAANGQLKINEGPTDILKDILEPSASILCMRGARVEVITEGPEDLVVIVDRLRLKQICLNLAINASKFVERGFIRLRAEVADTGNVCIFVEDSGPGVPQEKRTDLFSAFQESLDLLHQGTGMGLFICHKLSRLMGAKLWLDESYKSGVFGCPGARFVIDLQRPRIDVFDKLVEEETNAPPNPVPAPDFESTTNEPIRPDIVDASKRCQETPERAEELPKSLKILFVDDEAILRKLFIRSLKRVAPTWTAEEAGNANTALQRISETNFDIIFFDQYMPCIEHPMLGTEAVRQARALGAMGTICGLSANDMEKDFLEAGANGFLMKPFPCEKNRLQQALLELLQGPKESVTVQ